MKIILILASLICLYLALDAFNNGDSEGCSIFTIGVFLTGWFALMFKDEEKWEKNHTQPVLRELEKY